MVTLNDGFTCCKKGYVVCAIGAPARCMCRKLQIIFLRPQNTKANNKKNKPQFIQQPLGVLGCVRI